MLRPGLRAPSSAAAAAVSRRARACSQAARAWRAAVTSALSRAMLGRRALRLPLPPLRGPRSEAARRAWAASSSASRCACTLAKASPRAWPQSGQSSSPERSADLLRASLARSSSAAADSVLALGRPKVSAGGHGNASRRRPGPLRQGQGVGLPRAARPARWQLSSRAAKSAPVVRLPADRQPMAPARSSWPRLLARSASSAASSSACLLAAIQLGPGGFALEHQHGRGPGGPGPAC